MLAQKNVTPSIKMLTNLRRTTVNSLVSEHPQKLEKSVSYYNCLPTGIILISKHQKYRVDFLLGGSFMVDSQVNDKQINSLLFCRQMEI